jgi:hypothetical protein
VRSIPPQVEYEIGPARPSRSLAIEVKSLQIGTQAVLLRAVSGWHADCYWYRIYKKDGRYECFRKSECRAVSQ